MIVKFFCTDTDDHYNDVVHLIRILPMKCLNKGTGYRNLLANKYVLLSIAA